MIDFTKIDEATSELQGQSDRAAVLVGASLLDDQLKGMLRRYMIRHTDADEQFQGYGPLSSFKAKIDIAFLLGLIPRDIRKALHVVRDIRNQFAHTYQSLTLGDSSTQDRICSLPGLMVILAQRKAFEISEEGRRKIDKLQLRSPRRLWEIAIGDLYGHLAGYLKCLKSSEEAPNAYEGWHETARKMAEFYREGPNLPEG